jgi:DNA repair protein RecN (Recombination protein N)
MLKNLYLENLAVIERAEIPFTKGLNVFTGETGAGKSVLVGGLSAALGKRVSRDMVRTGAKKGIVTAVFDELPETVTGILREMGFVEDSRDNDSASDISEISELLLTREITADGKSSARINNRPATAAALAEIGAYLCDIHGQHDSLVLSNVQMHRDLLDNFGQNLYGEQMEKYRNSFRTLQKISSELNTAVKKADEAKRRYDEYKRVVNDIAPLKIKPGEDAETDFLYSTLESGEAVKTAAEAAGRLVSNDEETGVLEMMYHADKLLEPFGEKNPRVKEVLEQIIEIEVLLETLSPDLSALSDSIDFDEEKLFRLKNRKEAIDDIKRRYGGAECSLEAALSRLQEAETACKIVTDSEEELKSLRAKKTEALKTASAQARELSALRSEAAERMSEALQAELRDLDMPDVRLTFNIVQGNLTINGMDTVEMLFSPNAGEEPRPLVKIASGGELSRVMLSVKNVTRRSGAEVMTMIFDEIDSGVSGRAAMKIGRKLSEISAGTSNAQTLAVTHLAQIAIYAENHLLIEKKTAGGRTFTTVETVENEARVREIARIQVGDNITELSLKNAEEQLRSVSCQTV